MYKRFIALVCVATVIWSFLFTDTVLAVVFPRASSTPSSTISYIDITGQSFSDVFMITSLQGNINRTQPRIYVISPPLIDKPPVFTGKTGQYWLDKLAGYTKTQYTDKYQMVKDFASSLSGCVIYDPAIFNYTGNVKQFQPSDDNLAKLNVTAMLCARHNAIALTAAQRNTLINDYGVNLTILADTTTSTFSNWVNCYNYALNNLASYMRNDITAHNAHFLLADMDYIIAQKIFTYNRVLNATSEQAGIEDQILDLCSSNTPVIGVWHLHQDEGGLVAEITNHGRFFTVTYESWNLSWTTGLPPASIPNQYKRSLTLDNNKVYISFNVTEGDNHSFLFHTLPVLYDQSERTSYPIGFEGLNTMNELSPNIASYLYDNLNNSSNIITSVSGVGYTNPIMPAAYRDTFFNLTNSYMSSMKTAIVKTMWNNMEMALPYADISNVYSVLVGYRGSQMGGGEPTVDGVKDTSFCYKGKPFFKNYDFSHMNDILNYKGPSPAFFSVSALGWNVKPEAIKEICDKLPSNFMIVSPEEMTDLYKQYYNPKFTNITEADFNTCMNTEEMGFIYHTSNSHVDYASKLRYADGSDYWVYKFDMNDSVTSAYIQMDLQNNYRVYASKDNTSWTQVAAAPSDVHDGSNRTIVCADLTSYLTDNTAKTVYIKFTDGSPADGWGPGLRRVKLYTNMSQLKKHYMDTKGNGEETPFMHQDSGSYIYSNSARVADGAQYWIYKFDLDDNAASAVVTMDIMNNYRVAASRDASSWTQIAAAASDVHDGSNRAEVTADISSFLNNNSSKVVYLKFFDGSSGDGWGASLYDMSLFTENSEITGLNIKTVNNGEESPYLFKDSGSYLMYGKQQGRRVADGNAYFVYKFNFNNSIAKAKSVMQLENNYRVYASKDNSVWTQVAAASSDVHDGSNRAYVPVDLTAYLADNPEKDIYLKFSDGSTGDGWGAVLGKIKLVTDMTQVDYESMATKGDGNEASYMHQDSGSYIYNNSARIADGTGCWVYKLDLDDSVAKANVLLDIANNYRISASKDGNTWTQIAAAASDVHDMSNRAWIPVDLVSFLSSNTQKTVYLKFFDGSTADGWGAALFNLTLTTGKSQINKVDIPAKGDGQEAPFMYTDSGSWIAEGAHRVADGNQYWIYKFDLDDTSTRLAVWLDIMNNYRVAASKDGTSFTQVAASASDIHDGSNRSAVKLDLTSYLDSNQGKTVYLKFYDGSTGDGWGASLYSLKLYTNKTQWSSVSMNTDGTGDEIQFIEWDSTTISGSAKTAPYYSGVTYRFDMDDGKTSLNMVIDIANNYVIYATGDPTATYTKVAQASSDVHDESNRTDLNVNLTSFLTDNPSKTVYVYIGNADPENCSAGGKFWDITLN